MKRSFRALTHRDYFFVWTGSLLSNIGNWMENVGQGWVVASQTHSAFMVELLSFAQFVPVILFTVPAGILADKYNRKYVLMGAQLAMCAAATTLAVLAHYGLASPTVIIMITFIEGAAWAFNGPAWQTVVPHLVPRKDLESAIALNSVQYNLARLIGPALAGLVVAHWGFAYAFDLNAASFLAVIAAISLVNFKNAAIRNTKAATGDPQTMAQAWRWVRQHKGSRRIILSIALFAFFSAPLQGLMPYFASDVLHVGPTGLGTLLACLGGGAIMGAILLGQLPPFYPRYNLIPVSMTVLGGFMMLYSHAPSIPFTYIMLFISGIFWLWTMISCNTAMQLLVPDRIRGRVMSIMLVAHVGLLPFGHLLGGVLAEHLGPRLTTLLMAASLTAMGVYTFWKREPEIDAYPSRARRIRLQNYFSELIRSPGPDPGP